MNTSQKHSQQFIGIASVCVAIGMVLFLWIVVGQLGLFVSPGPSIILFVFGLLCLTKRVPFHRYDALSLKGERSPQESEPFFEESEEQYRSHFHYEQPQVLYPRDSRRPQQ